MLFARQKSAHLLRSSCQHVTPAVSRRAFSAPSVDHDPTGPPKFSKDKSTELKDEAAVQAAAERERMKNGGEKQHKRGQTSAEADEELCRRLEEMSGEGGASGIEFEDGKPASMKRSVRNNMFRYI